MSPLDVSTPGLAGAVLAPAGSGLVLAEWSAAPGPPGQPLYQAPLHEHEEAEAWYVLSGLLRVRVGDDEVEVGTGGAVVVPGGIPHTYWNPGTEPTRYLLVMGARTYGLIQALHAGGGRDERSTKELFALYGARLLE